MTAAIRKIWHSDVFVAVAVTVTALLVIASLAASAIVNIHNEKAQAQQLMDAAPFHEGDIVRSRIGGFRGIVLRLSCYPPDCEYFVRFYTVSMEPQWVNAPEIETAR